MKDWVKVKLGTLLTESKIESANPNADKRISVKLNVKGIEKRPLTKDKEGATKYYTRKAGQFIYGKQNLHKGAFGIVPEELDGYESSSDIPAFDVDESCYPEWIYYFFKKGNFYLKLESLAKGVGSKRIHPHQIFDLDIFLPKKEEQKEILDRIAELESNHGALLFEIESQESILSQLRQSILQDAIQGKLTEKWREQNPDVEPASELLKRIQVEKEQLIKDKKIKKENPLPKIKADEIPFEIPESWEWCRWHDLLSNNKYSMKRGPFGSALRKDDFVNIGIRVFEQYNPINDDPYWVRYFITEDKYEKLKAFSTGPGDLLISCSGATLGRITLLPDDVEPGIINQALLKLNLHDQIIKSEYFVKLFRSEYMQSRIWTKAKGMAIPNMVGVPELKIICIPLPSITEQDVILKRLDQIQADFDLLEAEIQSNKEKSKQLLQTVLSEILGEENTINFKPVEIKNTTEEIRERVYDSKTTFMELVELLRKHGRLHAEDLWKMSKFPQDIDKFYAELKEQIEKEKTIKESTEKGYLEPA